MARSKKSLVTAEDITTEEVVATKESTGNAVEDLLNKSTDIDKELIEKRKKEIAKEAKSAKASLLVKPSLLEAAREIIEAQNAIRPAGSPEQTLNNLINECLEKYVADNLEFLQKYKEARKTLIELMK